MDSEEKNNDEIELLDINNKEEETITEEEDNKEEVIEIPSHEHNTIEEDNEVRTEIQVSVNVTGSELDADNNSTKDEIIFTYQKPKKVGIFFSPNNSFLEKKILQEVVKELKTNGLEQLLWYEENENSIWFSNYCSVIEKIPFVIIYVTENSIDCLLFHIFCGIVKNRLIYDKNMRIQFICMGSHASNYIKSNGFSINTQNDVLLSDQWSRMSLDATISVIIAACLPRALDDYENYDLHSDSQQSSSSSSISAALTNNYIVKINPLKSKSFDKSIRQWSIGEVDNWLQNLQVKEFYRQTFMDWLIDGNLLMTLSEEDLIKHLDIENKVVRRRILSSLVEICEKEHTKAQHWHWRCRLQQRRENKVYIICDPNDIPLLDVFKKSLNDLGFIVLHHKQIGKNEEEYLENNSQNLASAEFIILLLTANACTSTFVYHEIMFTFWLQEGRRRAPMKNRQRGIQSSTLVVLLLQNMWSKLRPALKAALGDQPSIDFSSLLFMEGIKVLENFLRPPKSIPGVVLEENYQQLMLQEILPLDATGKAKKSHLSPPSHAEIFTVNNPSSAAASSINNNKRPIVFFSYHWNTSSQAERMKKYLERVIGVVCWLDQSVVTQNNATRISGGGASASAKLPAIHNNHNNRRTASTIVNRSEQLAPMLRQNTLQDFQHRSMNDAAIVISCITHEYLQSNNCLKDLSVADMLHKPIVPVLFHYTPWPPENCPPAVKRVLSRIKCIDLSNERLFKRNIPDVVERVQKYCVYKN